MVTNLPECVNSSTNPPPRPTALEVRPDGIPADLKERAQWVVWMYVEETDPDTGEVDWDKPPFNAQTGGLASSTNPKTWSSFNVALDAYQRGSWDGVGFVLHKKKDDGGADLVGIDLDK